MHLFREHTVLALNAAEGLVQLALARGGDLLGAVELSVAGRANEHMAPAAVELLAGQGLAVPDLAGVASVRGPGGFTGLRMSLAFCLGLARGAGLPMAGLDYLPLVAAGPGIVFTGLLAVWVRSRAGQVYAQHFQASSGDQGPTPLDGPRALALPDAARHLAEAAEARPGPVAVVGSGAIMPGAAEALAESGLDNDPPPGGPWCDPAPEILARAACSAAYGPEPPEPLYLRVSDAEENLAAIARSRGLDPDEAAKRLARAMAGPDNGQS